MKFLFFRFLCSERFLKDKDDSCLKEKGETGKKIESKKPVQDEL